MAISLLRFKFPFSLAEGKREVLLEDWDGWALEIIQQTLSAGFGLLNSSFSRCCHLLDSSILFPSCLPYGRWGLFTGLTIDKPSGSRF